jgi:cytochrome P450
MAGADSTAIALRSVFYYMMKNPRTLKNARSEVDAAFAEGKLTSPIQHNQAAKLIYVNAVIREAFRLFSPFAVSQQRYSPPQGIALVGTHIPGGWRIGCNPAVSHHHKEVFGEDTNSFRPERWIDNSPEQIKLMNKCMQHFGAGTRRCTGQHVRFLAEELRLCTDADRLL